MSESGSTSVPFFLTRGLMWLLAIGAFSTCVSYSGELIYNIRKEKMDSKLCYNNYLFYNRCKNGASKDVVHKATYPYSLDSDPIRETCGGKTATQTLPGDFSVAAAFFVFTGVYTFLYTLCLGLVFNVCCVACTLGIGAACVPVIEFASTAVMILFWLAGSAAWAAKIPKLTDAMGGEWIFTDPGSLCHLNQDGSHSVIEVESCSIIETGGSFSSLHASAVFGFFSCAASVANIVYLVKMTDKFLNGGSD